MFQNYIYDGTLKGIIKEKKKNDTGTNDFDNILQNKDNILRDTPDQRYDARMALGDPESADIRIVGLGHSECGNSSLVLRLFYNEYSDEPSDHPLLQWEQHQMQYRLNEESDLLRISYFDLKGFDDIITKQEMDDRIRDTINHSFNVILLYYSIDERRSFVDSNGYSVQDIKTYVEYWMSLLDTKKFMLLLVGNKLDSDNEGEREVSTTEGQNLAQSWGNIPFIEVSAQTGQNIKQLLDIIAYIYASKFEDIDGDLNEAALFDEDKCGNAKTVVKEDEEYEEYIEEKEVDTFEQIMRKQNPINIQNDVLTPEMEEINDENTAEIEKIEENETAEVIEVAANDKNDDKKTVEDTGDRNDEIEAKIEITDDKKEESEAEMKEEPIPVKIKKKVKKKKKIKKNISDDAIPKKEIKKRKSQSTVIKKTDKITKKRKSKAKVPPIKKRKSKAVKKQSVTKLEIKKAIPVQGSWTTVISFFEWKPMSLKPRPRNNNLTKHVMSVKEFNKVPLKNLMVSDVSDTSKDNYDIAKKICKFYDSQFGDTDTVCLVAEKGKQPSISFFCKGKYFRKHKNICGKHVLIYRACKHQPAKEPIVSKQEFEKYVKKISIKHEKSSVNAICDLMDKKFGLGCHYARSTTKRANYDIYSRFSDKYDCGFKLPSGAYIIAWRR